jgi:hypothetical protein
VGGAGSSGGTRKQQQKKKKQKTTTEEGGPSGGRALPKNLTGDLERDALILARDGYDEGQIRWHTWAAQAHGAGKERAKDRSKWMEQPKAGWKREDFQGATEEIAIKKRPTRTQLRRGWRASDSFLTTYSQEVRGHVCG